jgi:hypothetical protein
MYFYSVTGLLYLRLAERTILSFKEITNYRCMFGKFPFQHVFRQCTRLGTLDFSNTRVSHFTVNHILKLAVVAECPIYQLVLTKCRNIAGPLSLNVCNQLEFINIRYCKSITSLPGLTQQKSLKTFRASGCKKLKGEFDVSNFPRLYVLEVTECTQLTLLRDRARDVLLTRLTTYFDVDGVPQHYFIGLHNALPWLQGLLDEPEEQD